MPSSSSKTLSKELIKGLFLGVSISATAIFFLQHKKKNVSSKNTSYNEENTNVTNESSYNNDDASTQYKDSKNPHKTSSIPKSLREELISRTSLYFPETIETHITKSSIIVLGCGGVGSHAAISLARSGVKRMRLIDMDMVTLSSLNRHACATLKDVGISKVEVVKRTIDNICGGQNYCTVDVKCEMYTGERNDLLDYDYTDDIAQNWDFVIDAIDDIPTKTSLLSECYKRKIRVVTCMGAGGKSDPTRLHMGDLNSASRDPLAAKLRNRLKQIDPMIATSDLVTAVFSSEKVVMKLADFTQEQKEQGVHKFGAVDGMRVRVLPVLGSMPAIMGQACAAYALCEIGQKPFTPVSGERLSRSVRHRTLQHFTNRESYLRKKMEDMNLGNDVKSTSNVKTSDMQNMKEEKPNYTNYHLSKSHLSFNNIWVGTSQIDMDDVDFLLSTQWRQKCAITTAKLGTVLELIRWDMSKPPTLDNLVLMGIKSIRKFDESGWDRSTFGEDVRKKVEKRLSHASDENQYY